MHVRVFVAVGSVFTVIIKTSACNLVEERLWYRITAFIDVVVVYFFLQKLDLAFVFGDFGVGYEADQIGVIAIALLSLRSLSESRNGLSNISQEEFLVDLVFKGRVNVHRSGRPFHREVQVLVHTVAAELAFDVNSGLSQITRNNRPGDSRLRLVVIFKLLSHAIGKQLEGVILEVSRLALVEDFDNSIGIVELISQKEVKLVRNQRMGQKLFYEVPMEICIHYAMRFVIDVLAREFVPEGHRYFFFLISCSHQLKELVAM